MDSIKMKRLELLKIVKENATKHVADYDEAVEDYKLGVVKVAKANLKIANSGELEKFSTFQRMPAAPVNYAENYSRAIRMLELSVEDVIEIEDHTFNQLVLDEWGWKQAFVAQSALYKSL